MKHVLAIVIILCFAFPLTGCGGRTPLKADNHDNADVGQDGKTADNDVKDIGFDFDDIEYEFDFEGGNLTWDPDKMGGMPQPEGTTIFLEMDLTQSMEKDFAYSYSISGLTKEVFEEYIKLVEKKFPKIITSLLTDTEGTFVATTEDLDEMFLVTYIKDKVSLVQYMD